MSVSASFVWRCLSGATMTPFPHPSHRTGHEGFPHPALGQDFTPSPTARRLELRSLPSTGITRLQRYYEPLRHPRAPGLSLAGVRLGIAAHALGLMLKANALKRDLIRRSPHRYGGGASSRSEVRTLVLLGFSSCPAGSNRNFYSWRGGGDGGVSFCGPE